MKRVSRRTLDWIYSVLPETLKSIPELSISLLDSASSWKTRSSAYLLLAIVLLSWGYIIYASTVAAGRQLRKKYPDKILWNE